MEIRRDTVDSHSVRAPAGSDTAVSSGSPGPAAPSSPASGNKTFLLAEDSAGDVLLMRRAFSEAGFGDALRVVSNGEAALEYLRGAGEYANRFTYPMPDVVLLDLNLPRKDGFEVLGWIRSQSALKSMVVIILTASNRSTDADRAYDLGANYYLTKPGNFEALVEMTRCLQEWLKPELVLSDAAQQPRASS